MAHIVNVDYQRLLDLVNLNITGTAPRLKMPYQGITVTPSPVLILDPGPALTYLTAQGMTSFSQTHAGKSEYYLTFP